MKNARRITKGQLATEDSQKKNTQEEKRKRRGQQQFNITERTAKGENAEETKGQNAREYKKVQIQGGTDQREMQENSQMKKFKRGQTKVKDKVGQPKVKIQERTAKGENANETS